MIGWKKLALVSSFAAFGLVVALLLSAGAIYRYNHRTRSRKDWPPISLNNSGIKAELHTELRSGSVRYGFTVEPLSSNLADDFDRTVSDQAITKSFRVLLRDAGGFELCGEDAGGLTPIMGGTGKVSGLMSEGVLACAASDNLDSVTWDLVYQFPRLEARTPSQRIADVQHLVNDPKFLSLTPAQQRVALQQLTGDQQFSELSDAQVSQFVAKSQTAPKKPKTAGFEPLSDSDKLSSYDTDNGTLVTMSGMTFEILEGYQRFMVGQWARSGTPEYRAPLRYSCDSTGGCTIENRWNGQTVEAKRTTQDGH